jgi:hypothetical protein
MTDAAARSAQRILQEKILVFQPLADFLQAFRASPEKFVATRLN